MLMAVVHAQHPNKCITAVRSAAVFPTACLPPFPTVQTGCADIVIGREDGSLEVWDIDTQGQPQLVVSTQLPESITAVDGGYITNAGSPDIIVHTFTGKVGTGGAEPSTVLVICKCLAVELGCDATLGKCTPT